MATYIPGMTDYVPQFQPFQPDYNFLGNMLQNAQSKYDNNYNQLNQTYGTLLNSPMLRQDNLQQRDEFFKMIDQDIKKVSGMDLSLQQNVDSANKVFDSFYQNKEMVKDMVYTKEYQKQLEVGETYRNCLDCDRKYWEEGVNALHYKADEFKKANRQDTLNMNPGRYVPAVNLQEKVTDYAKKLLGTDGAFGLSTVTQSTDGKWQVTLKNGQLLSTPLQQLLLNQYGKDQDVIDMYDTQSYVNRKSFVAAHLNEFGGDEDKAENAYFNIVIPQYIEKAKTQYTDAKNLYIETNAYKNKLEEKLKTYGTEGNDELEAAIFAANLDVASSQQSLSYHENSVKALDVLHNDSDINTKRNTVDKMLGRDFMTKAISDSAINVAALTGQMSKTIDPYAKSAFDFSNDMYKLERQYDLMDRNDQNKTMRDLDKQKALADYLKQGSIVENKGTFKIGTPGTSTPESLTAEREAQDNINKNARTAVDAAEHLCIGYANTLLAVLDNKNSKKDESDLARATLLNIYGAYSDGKAGYDNVSNSFKNKDGEDLSDPSELITDKTWNDVYQKTQVQLKKNSIASDIHKRYAEGEGAQYQEQFDDHAEVFKIYQNKFRNNNDAVKKYGNTLLEDKEDWNRYFKKDNSLKNLNEYTKDYVKQYEGTAGTSDLRAAAREAYNKANENYNKFYNSGVMINGQPLVKGLTHSSAMGAGVGGHSAGGSTIYSFNTASPASEGTQGLLSFYNDAQKSDAIFAIGLHQNMEQALAGEGDADLAKEVYSTLINDIALGGKTAINGDVEYLDLALSDKNKVAINIKPSKQWLDKYKGTKEDPSKYENPRLLTEGITVYVDKNSASNTFTQNYSLNAKDIIHQNQDMLITHPLGGEVTILKPDAQGVTRVQGTLNVALSNGTIETMDFPVQDWGNAKGSLIYNRINAAVQEQGEFNKQVLKNKPQSKPLIKEVAELPSVKKVISSSGQSSTSQLLTQKFIESFQNIK